MKNERGWRHYLKYAAKTYRTGWKIGRTTILAHLGGMVLFDLIFVYAVMFLNRTIVKYLTETLNINLVIACIAGLFLIKITTDFLRVFETMLNEKIALSFRLEDENRIMEKVSRINYELLERPSYYDTYAMVNVAVSASVLNFVKDVHMVVINIINAVISIILLVQYHAWLGIILSLAEMLYIFLYLKYYDYSVKLKRAETPAKRKISDLEELLFDRKTVYDIKMNGSADMLMEKMNKSHAELYESYCKKNRAVIFTDSLSGIYHQFRDFAVTLVYLLRVFYGSLSMADYTLIMSLIGKAEDAASKPVSYVGILMDDLRCVSDYYDFMELEDERDGQKISRDKSQPCRITLKDFSFSYPESENEVLRHINLEINPGEVIAIVGENGAGKTTLVKNIMGLYSTYNGKLEIDGVDYRNIAAREIYDCFSMVMQNYVKYPFTLRDELVMGDAGKNTTDEELNELMRIVDGESILKGVKHGYGTYLSKTMDADGADLSEGQWQKLMLARALHRRRGIVVFDEPTASLDPIAEEVFYRNVIDKAEGTVIVVTHRLACTAGADRIVVLNHGEIAEMGSHNELMSKNGLYAEMYRTQAEGYTKESEKDE